MAKERVIRISTELDTSGMLSGINQMRQMLGNISVDSNLFKDVNKDLDKITKDILEVKNSLKNGIPEKEVTSFLNKIENINKVYSALPDKIKQVQINTQNIRFSNQTIQQLEALDQQIVKLGKDAKKAIGEDLKTSLRNAVPKDIISDATLKTLTEATDKTKAFSDYFDQMANSAEVAKAKVASSIKDIANTIVKNTDANATQKRAAFSQFGTAAMNALQGGAMVNVDAKAMAQNAANIGATKKQYEALKKAIIDYQDTLQSSNNVLAQRQTILDIINKAESDAAQMATQAANLTVQKEQTITNAVKDRQQAQQQAGQAAEANGKKTANALNQVSDSAQKATTHLQRQDSLLKQLASRAASLIGIGAVFNYITRGIRDAWNSIKELDKEFTAIAVVTDKTTSQLWQSFNTYAQMAQGLGVATKDAVATSALYYQQGLKTADVMTLTAETIKMAQIAGMDFKTATDQMTAALRGYNLEMSQANMVNDIFSTLAANAAVDTKELSYALTKTASIAESAGMSIDTTSAFLAKMIETTREAPENIGTAMKSIVARFEELKKNPLALSVDVEGEEVVANKVEAAIALAGVKLRDETTGQFRNLDDVFLELAKSWDNLDRNTQRYIATIAAGSRQQSRFIALMDGYDRTLELVELAQDSEGQSAAQFLKTLDSLDSKINKITNSLESLYQKFVNSDFFGGLLDGLNGLLQDFGDWDAGTLAAFAAAGVVLGNNLISGIRTSIQQQQLPKLFNRLVDNSKIKSLTDQRTDVLGELREGRQGLIKARNDAASAKSNIDTHLKGRTYGIDTANDLLKLKKLRKEITDTDAQIKKSKQMNLDTTQAEQKLNKLKTKETEVTNGIINNNSGWNKGHVNGAIKTIKGDLENDLEIYNAATQTVNSKTSSLAGLEKQREVLRQQSKEMQKEAKAQAEALKVTAGQAFQSAGMALVSSLTIGISMALEQDNPLAAISTSVSTFFLQMLPTLIQQGTAVAAAGAKNFKEVVTAAGGWVTLVIEGAALLISALAPFIANQIKNIKSEADKIGELTEELQGKQKELQESSEKLTAEAAVEKTKYKSIQRLTKNYDDLISKTDRTSEENEKLNKTIEDLATDFPDLVDYYDEAGNAVLKQRKEWETIVDLQKQSTQEAAQAALTAKMAEDYTSLQLAQLNTKQKGAIAQQNSAQRYTQQDFWLSGEEAASWGAIGQGLPGLIAGQIAKGLTWSVDANVNQEKTNKIRAAAERTDFNNDKQINSLRTQIARINALGINNNAAEYQEMLALPSTKLLETTEELKEWINGLSNTSSLKSELRKELEKTPDVLLSKVQNIYNEVTDQINALNPNYESEEYKKAFEQTTKDLQNYFVSYVQSFAPDLAEGYSEKGLQFLGRGYAEKKAKELEDLDVKKFISDNFKSLSGDGVQNFTNRFDQLYYQTTGKALTKEQRDQLNAPALTNMGQFDKIEEITDANHSTYLLLEQLISEMKSINLEKETAKEAEEVITKITQGLQNGSFNQSSLDIVNTGNYGNYSMDQLVIAEADFRKVDEATANNLQEEIDKIENTLSQMEPAFAEIGRKCGLDFAQSLIDAGTSSEQAEKLVKSLGKSLDASQMSSIFSMVTADSFDWGSIDQLKKLGVQLMDMGMSAEEATNMVWELRDSLNDPIKLTLDADKAVEDVTKVAGTLSDLKKGLKDLNAAVQEYNENGRLSGETVLDLIANGQLMYLEYDKQTKAITINKDAMVDYYNAQVAQAKLNLELKAQDVEQSIAALQQRKTSLEAQRKILVAAQQAEGKLTENQYEELTSLNNTYNQEILTGTGTFLTDLNGLYATGTNEIAKTAAVGGANIRDSLLSGVFTDISKSIDIEGTKATINGLVKGAETFAKGLPSYVNDIYKYQLDEAQIQAAIDKIDEEIKATDEFIEAQREYQDLIKKGIDFTDALTESGLDKFMNDTAKATSEANKELKEYTSTLEKYYNLLKDTEHAEEDYERAKKEYERNPTIENYQKMQQTRVDYGQQLLTQKATFEKERDEDVQRGEQSFVKFGLTPQDAKQIAELTSRKDVNQDELRNWLKDQGYDQDTAEKFEKLWEDYKKEIETDNSNIKAADDKLYEIQVDQENDLKKIEEDLRNFDRLKNIEQALSRLDKLMQDAERDLQDYYESGGKEGMNLQQYLHTQGAGIQELNLAASEISKVKSDIVAENKQLLDNYAIEVDGEWYLNPDTVGDLDPNGETYKALEGVFNQLNKIKDKEDEITDKQRDYAKAAKEALRAARKSYSDLVMKAADALAQLDQKAIDEVKKKYSMIQEEDEKYLNSLQKSIDKQRQLRDQANSYDDLEKQEKRLALLERDTSGANAAEIAALKEQIKDARQSLVDTEQDNIVNNISEANDLRKEKMDEETTFLQNVMDERTYDMQYYIERAQDIVNAAIDGDEGAYKRLLEILQKTDEAYYKGTKQMQEEWMEGWETNMITATGYVTALKDGTVTILGQTTKEIIKSLSTFAGQNIGKVSEVETKVNELAEVTKKIDMTKCFEDMKTAVEEARKELSDLITTFDGSKVHTQVEIEYKATGDVPGKDLYSGAGTDPNEGKKWVTFESATGKITGIYDSEEQIKTNKAIDSSGSGISGTTRTASQISQLGDNFKVGGYLFDGSLKDTSKKEPLSQQAPSSTPVQQESNLSEVSFNKWWDWWNSEGKANRIAIGKDGNIEGQVKVLGPTDADPEGNYHILNANSLKDAIMYWDNDKLKKLIKSDGTQIFKNGGLVNYTGPAWVDGTSTSPEAFLSAEDTRNFQELAKILQSVLNFDKAPVATSEKDKIQIKSGDTNIEIHIEVDKIDSEESMEELCDMVADRIQQSYSGGVSQP